MLRNFPPSEEKRYRLPAIFHAGGRRLSADLSYHLIIKAKSDKRPSDPGGGAGWMNFDLFPESHITFPWRTPAVAERKSGSRREDE